MTEPAHAKLSPSSSSRWMSCPGSVVLEDGEPDSENEYSREGTLAHAVAAHCLEKGINTDNILFFDLEDKKGAVKTEIVPMDMREYVQGYLDFVREQAKGKELLVEQGLSLSWLTGEKEAIGTADAVILDEGKLHLIDLKYGFNEVSADGNSQLRIYGLAASELYSVVDDFEQFELTIYQPRISNTDSEILTVDEMREFEAGVRAAVLRVEEARKSNSLSGFLKTGSHCKWCKAAAKCPKMASEVVEATLVDFDDETQTELPAPVDLAKAGAKLALVEGWLRAVRAKIEAELFSGLPVAGWKLVEGKRGNRAWIDEDAAEKALLACGAEKSKIMKSALVTPAQAEKKLKGNALATERLPELYSQKAGKPSVAPVSDKRPEYILKPEDDFTEVE